MTTPVNLNKARKAKAREADRAKADANAALSGVTKAARSLAKAAERQAQRRLDGLKRAPE